MTDEEISKLFDMGVPANALAERLGTSRGAIYNRIKRFKDPVGYALQQGKYEMRRAAKR